jgi:3-oxoacyl-[acyl-carrier-protein] synthase II
LGRTADATWRALLRGEHITTHSRLDASVHPHLPRVSSLAIEAARQAISEAGWIGDDAAIIVGTSKGPVEQWLKQPHREKQREQRDDFGLSAMAADIATHTGFSFGARLTLSAACASGLHALIRGCMLIQSCEAKRVLVVAAEASVHPLFLASFGRLGVLPPPGGLCRPFDIHRSGFLMSDAAAAVCLQADSDNGIHVDRFAMGGDATHLTGSTSDGAALRYLLKRAMPENPDLIHAHGTGTTLNDEIEIRELQSAVKNSGEKPQIFSHKGAIGHTLGASGLVSVVINCICHRTDIVPGNVNTHHPLVHDGLSISQSPINRPVRRSLVIASGFGGPIAIVALSNDQSGEI